MQSTQTILSNKKPTLVSFIITYYNLPIDILCECIDSVLALSLSRAEREIIIVDDGSDYSPMNDLLKYGEDIKYVRKANGGVSTARNTGLKMAEGEFIQFIDGDDMLLGNHYEHCLDIIRYNETDMVVFDFTNKRTGNRPAVTDDTQFSGTEYMHNNNIRGMVWCYLFRKTVAGKLSFRPGIRYGEDEEFTPQLLLRADILHRTNATAYFYRERSDSAINKNDLRSKLERIDDNLKVILHLQDISFNLPASDTVALQRRIAQLTMDYIYNMIVLTRSKDFITKKLDVLLAKGLFPLPDRDYTAKYKWFRRMTNSRIGLNILIGALPLLKREK